MEYQLTFPLWTGEVDASLATATAAVQRWGGTALIADGPNRFVLTSGSRAPRLCDRIELAPTSTGGTTITFARTAAFRNLAIPSGLVATPVVKLAGRRLAPFAAWTREINRYARQAGPPHLC